MDDHAHHHLHTHAAHPAHHPAMQPHPHATPHPATAGGVLAPPNSALPPPTVHRVASGIQLSALTMGIHRSASPLPLPHSPLSLAHPFPHQHTHTQQHPHAGSASPAAMMFAHSPVVGPMGPLADPPAWLNSPPSSSADSSASFRRADASATGPQLVVFMVGLPARGKSYISKKLTRYLTWLGYSTRVFNVGNRRRAAAAAASAANTPAHEAPAAVPAGAGTTSTFFDPSNTPAASLRDQLALEALDELVAWLRAGRGRVAIHDATNSTQLRRDLLVNHLKPHMPHIKLLFLESICTDQRVIDANVRMKLQSPDYLGIDPDTAIADFTARMRNYERAYQPLGPHEDAKRWSYIKVIDVGRQVVTSNLRGYLSSQIVFYLMNINIEHRTIWLSRHGESVFNVQGRIGGDAPLTDNGRRYAAALARFLASVYDAVPGRHAPKLESDAAAALGTPTSPLVAAATARIGRGEPALPPEAYESAHDLIQQHISLASHEQHDDEDDDEYSSSSGSGSGSDSSDDDDSDPEELSPTDCDDCAAAHSHRRRRKRVPVWTSTLRRTIETAAYLPRTAPHLVGVRSMKLLNEIHSGQFEGLTPMEIEAGWPGEVARRQAHKLAYRYPGLGGESYLDVIARLKPVIIETERLTHDVVVVTHNVVARIMLAYYLGVGWDEMPRLEVPLHHLYALQPRPYGTELVRFRYDPDLDEIVRIDEPAGAAASAVVTPLMRGLSISEPPTPIHQRCDPHAAAAPRSS
ncbi:Fructose-2,6-bisphosphatase [Blastocladiella emersonii ATCC 22665]|nr:Fructose-2,6-bisphosphatase [Blastocladiella emersonii ATCC 22665]